MGLLALAERLRATAHAINQGDTTNSQVIRLNHRRASSAERTGFVDALRWAADVAELEAWPSGPPATEEETK